MSSAEVNLMYAMIYALYNEFKYYWCYSWSKIDFKPDYEDFLLKLVQKFIKLYLSLRDADIIFGLLF